MLQPATLEAEKLRQRKVRFLSVTARPTGDVGPLQRGRIPSPPPRASAESRSSSPTRTVSSRSSERFRVMSGPLPTKGYVMLPRFKCSSDAQRKTSEQAAKMRERQKRYVWFCTSYFFHAVGFHTVEVCLNLMFMHRACSVWPQAEEREREVNTLLARWPPLVYKGSRAALMKYRGIAIIVPDRI